MFSCCARTFTLRPLIKTVTRVSSKPTLVTPKPLIRTQSVAVSSVCIMKQIPLSDNFVFRQVSDESWKKIQVKDDLFFV